MFKNRKGENINVRYAAGSGALHVMWGIEKCGFGELYISHNKNRDVLEFDTENMSRESIKAILCKLVDEGFFVDFETADKKTRILSLTELNSLKLFSHEYEFTIPFHIEVVENEKSLVEMRWHIEKKGSESKIVHVFCNIEKVVEIIKANHEANPMPDMYEDGVNDSEVPFDIFAYGFLIEKLGFGSEVVKAEECQWTVTEKQSP